MIATEKKYIRLRVFIVGFFFSLLFVIIGARAVYLQVFCESWLSQEAAKQYEKSFISQGKRGTIYDTHHREMAVSIDVTSIAARPARITDVQLTSDALAKALNLDRIIIKRKLTSEKPFLWIKRKVTPKETKMVKDLNLSGIDFIPEHSRFYPNRNLAAQLLGFSGIDGHGMEGIEFYYDTYLQGANVKFKVLKDAFGREFAEENGIGTIEPGLDGRGNNLILTIDRTIQFITEEALAEAVKRFSAKSGTAIVMAPESGAILALAQFPFFNPNTYNDFDKELWRIRAVTDQFEPGSTMKIFCAATAIESGICKPNTIFFCENGAYKIGRNVIHDVHSYGWLSLEEIVKFSSNIGAVKVSKMIGPEIFYKSLRGFGFGSKTGVDCPGETAGSLALYKKWSEIDAGAISFGQGISVSALQFITAASAIANGGILMKPYLVQAITDQQGRLIQNFGPQKIRRVISAETARTVVTMMRAAVNQGGTGINASLEGYSVCGKTGTAQKVDAKGGYARDKYIGSFIGFAPAEKPEAVILVIIDEPQGGHYGGVVAAPAFRKIAHETLDYMNIPPKVNKSDRLIVLRVNEAHG